MFSWSDTEPRGVCACTGSTRARRRCAGHRPVQRRRCDTGVRRIIYAGGGTWVQRQAGVDDTPDAMYAYLQAEIGDAVRPDTLRRFVDDSPGR